METEWFYQSMGTEFGPFTNRELIELVRDRTVRPDTMLKKNNSQWVAARSVNGLLERAGVLTADCNCPSCGYAMETHEEFCSQCGRQVEKAILSSRAPKKSIVAAVQAWLASVT